jgi:microcystin-dependent protein
MDSYLGEIKLLPWNWAPRGWMLCQGQLLPINQYTALFSLLGTTYGGNGTTNFALPDLRGRAPNHQGTFQGSPYVMGEIGGSETVTLITSQLPAHQHALMAETTPGTDAKPINNLFAEAPVARYASDASNTVTMNPASIQPIGGSQPHNNMQPYLVLSYCICTSGIFPSRN